MAPSFDLVSEPWIPCVRLDGTPDELGLLDTLTQAHELREVVDASPLVTASLHRLLLAILHRNFGPRNFDAWRELWKAGQFDAEVLSGYFEEWRHRFDLFDEERPFYQNAEMEGVQYHPLTVFAEELASGNNPALFAHNTDDRPLSFVPSDAARLLLAMQNYDLSGTRSNPEGAGPAYPDAAPLALGFTFMPIDNSLFQTLLLNMVTHDPINNDHIQANDEDVPAWERRSATALGERFPDGYVDYLTWQSRCLHLKPEEGAGDQIEVKSAVRAAGEDFAGPLGEVDPMIAYVRNRTPRRGQPPYSAYKGSVVRSLWRDSMVLLRDIEGQSQRPSVLDHVARATQERILPRSASFRLWALGLVRGSQAAKVEYWRHERLPLCLRYLTDDDLLDELRHCLQMVEEIAAVLRGKGLSRLAREALFPTRKPDDLSERNWDEVHRLSASLAGEGRDAANRNRTGTNAFWGALELPFRRLVPDLAEEGANREGLVADWVLSVAGTAQRTFDSIVRDMQPSARNLRAVSKARSSLRYHIGQITNSYEEEVTAHAD